MELRNFKIYTICVNYEYDEGFCWDTDKMDIIDVTASEAIKKAQNACVNKNTDKKDFKIVSSEITSEINLIDIYNYNGILNYYK